MAGRHERRQRLADRVGRQRVLHGRIAEQQLARRVEQRDRVFEVLDGRLQIRLLTSERRAIRGELLADGVEEITELAELVARRQIQRHAELALAESRQAASQNVEGAAAAARGHRRRRWQWPTPLPPSTALPTAAGPTLPHQRRRHANPDGAEILVAPFQRLLDLDDRLLVGEIQEDELVQRAVVRQRCQVTALLDRLTNLRPDVVATMMPLASTIAAVRTSSP